MRNLAFRSTFSFSCVAPAIILDMDSSESPTYGEQEGSAYRSHGRQDSGRRSARVRLLNRPTVETTMQVVADRAAEPIAIQTDLRAIFVSLELSRSTWLITSLSPGGGEKMSKHSVPAGDIAGLLKRFAQLNEKARARTGRDSPIIVIQEAGLDGFWIHRVLQSEGRPAAQHQAAGQLRHLAPHRHRPTERSRKRAGHRAPDRHPNACATGNSALR